ncbi:glycoside hydrolase family 76 protein [Arthrobacter sp. PAMC 25486]|uniref:glycoside hydrolase family 76 protein n=1 Tax=Arthrobacter sp. PAMC 25486 TaxID=1494608 RepID=UPI00068A8670|nr:glycoside hydrolase family 76 protein [Arthrobacter sp. PAMC 25486]
MTRQFKDPAAQAEDWAALARDGATTVNTTFGHRLMGLPGTWIGAIAAPAAPAAQRPTPWSEWHYWWQAHYLDAIIDAGFQGLEHGERATARLELRRAQQLLRGIMLRNFGRFPNHYYDDMAWLALAAGRLNELSLRLAARPARLALFATRTLTRHLHSAHDSVLGGGLYWSRKRDFKNTPVNGPAALHFARIGERQGAAAIADWLRRELFSPKLGLYIDGVHPTPPTPATPTGRSVEHTIYTYNQGPILAALLELGRPQDLEQAAALIDAVKVQLSTPGAGIRLEPGGDGRLFTGILCRYLALAARDERLPAQSRDTASCLIRETARKVIDQEPRQLSGAVQRWMLFSAAASL